MKNEQIDEAKYRKALAKAEARASRREWRDKIFVCVGWMYIGFALARWIFAP